MPAANSQKPCRYCLNRRALPPSKQRKVWPIAINFLKLSASLKDASPEERYQARLEHSKLVLEAFLSWLKEQMPRVLPKSALGKAIKYCRTQWERLETFLEDGHLEIDNNRGERSIKPFVIGRKNWLFSNTSKGARSSTIIYIVLWRQPRKIGASWIHSTTLLPVSRAYQYRYDR